MSFLVFVSHDLTKMNTSETSNKLVVVIGASHLVRDFRVRETDMFGRVAFAYRRYTYSIYEEDTRSQLF